MKVIYEVQVTEMLYAETLKAKLLGKKIEKITLTGKEFDKLVEETTPIGLTGKPHYKVPGTMLRWMSYYGVAVVEE